MHNAVENSIAEKIDTYFKATRRWDGVYWAIKLPWNKQGTWLKPKAYFQFIYDIANLLEPPQEVEE